MSLKQMFRAASVTAVLAASGAVSAAPIVLDFEGIGDLNPVGNFYNGGAGTNYGISFSAATLAVVDSDAGGSGNIANEPSPNTVMFFLDASNAVLNYNPAGGFADGFSFFYTSTVATTVTVWSGLNATGTLLGSITLAAQYNANNCGGDPTGQFCNWSTGSLFLGNNVFGRSINFGGAANATAFDNITFGSTTPGSGTVPEPASLALVGAALLGVAVSRRREA